MDDETPDGRSSISRGYVLASRASSIGFQMVAPLIAGLWLDNQCGTRPWFLVGGVVLGFVGAMMAVVRLAGEAGSKGRDSNRKPSGDA